MRGLRPIGDGKIGDGLVASIQFLFGLVAAAYANQRKQQATVQKPGPRHD
jgi:hypothetical protein